MDLETSPLALPFPDMPSIEGVTLRVARAGYKTWDRADLTFAELAEGTALAGVFTRNVCCSSEVEIGREQVKQGRARALVVNAGNSNAFTGYRGREAVDQIMSQVADALGCEKGEVLVSSTGVIGVPLPKDKAREGIAKVLEAQPASWEQAATTIGTTDTFAKGATVSAMLGDTRVSLNGIIKGSGMIAPDMATMLGYVFTDATVEPGFLQQCLSKANAGTFNCITVDGDTSTSDSLLLAATGRSKAPEISDLRSKAAKDFTAALKGVMLDLAHQVVRDGEGATKFVEVAVTGAASDADAHKVAMAIANSPLVKTAVAGEDPNWGRVVMAVGKSGAKADRDLLSIRFGDILVAEKGWVAESYSEEAGAAYMKQPELVIGVDMGLGKGQATAWTCDLTNRYIEINADYRS